MDLVWVVLAYLVGSLSFGRIAGVIRGFNLAERDTPGASGTFRQLGPKWGLAVALADVLKGVLAAYLSQWAQAPWAMPLMGVAVVAGHNWPLYFGFRGGGGIAPTLGFFGFLYPTITLVAVGIGLAVAGLYWQLYWKNHRGGWYPIPVGALVGYIYALIAFWPTGKGFWAFLLVSLVVALRGLRMIRKDQ
ncbi:glycerol-3-phosphate acyltransferase [Meiothermus sp.]|uniref:glycerol-3-phosphate acyltransferase n=1 Tax=Meiothermus sp. TaxID=1955249 RepID=UPI0021DED7FD|nr:glycerol-3-phosphate acyltransferase [Meiothermus sp.]GIW33235.1 MAG: membrane protein [Meiothermus sp.]